MQCYFFKYLLGFLYNLAGFQNNIKKVQEKFPAKFFMFLRVKSQMLRVLKLQYDVNKIFACASVANKFVYLNFFWAKKTVVFEENVYSLAWIFFQNCFKQLGHFFKAQENAARISKLQGSFARIFHAWSVNFLCF